MTRYAAMIAGYRFTRQDGQPLGKGQADKINDALFELIGSFAQEHGLIVEGAADFEHADAPELRQAEQYNKFLPGEQGRSGVYADDYCKAGYLWVFEDRQGDVHMSIGPTPGPRLMHPTLRMASSCARRPHVLNAARELARALVQDDPATPQTQVTDDTPERFSTCRLCGHSGDHADGCPLEGRA